MNNRFIVLEGSEGVGKSTASAFLVKALQEKGHEALMVREPGGTEFGEAMRAKVLTGGICLEAEILTLFAARAQLIHEVIVPSLKRGAWVVCDRFYYSSLAYQGFGRAGGCPKALARIERLIADFVSVCPAYAFYLEAKADVLDARRTKRGGTSDVFERQDAAFFARVALGFAYCIAHHNLISIDAQGTPNQVVEQIMHKIDYAQ